MLQLDLVCYRVMILYHKNKSDMHSNLQKIVEPRCETQNWLLKITGLPFSFLIFHKNQTRTSLTMHVQKKLK